MAVEEEEVSAAAAAVFVAQVLSAEAHSEIPTAVPVAEVPVAVALGTAVFHPAMPEADPPAVSAEADHRSIPR